MECGLEFQVCLVQSKQQQTSLNCKVEGVNSTEVKPVSRKYSPYLIKMGLDRSIKRN